MSEITDCETLKAERDAALNTCTIIANALGVSGAIAGDTLAMIQRLVSENEILKSLNCDLCNELREYEENDNDFSDIRLSSANSFINLKLPATNKAIDEIRAQGIDILVSNLEDEQMYYDEEDWKGMLLAANYAIELSEKLRNGEFN